ncbi:polymerase [Mangrovactinospora gilvigrisea]|uniref:Polymerase n=1 Tax=Mangrovactinospora gilvigrisea TaxID=1428644 RepID=A0A1J7BFT1_9ACTN|nr:DUF4240 domain-containing protein [Mangrovactinospora gilvigrisea]OIV37539.1 polymerase [Mangrovactinospora gilvigrisea]
MYESEFWRIIDATRKAAQGDPVDHAERLVERLAELSPEEVVDFARLFELRLTRSYTWGLWAAAAVLLGEADEDDFEAFRCWLIGQGRAVYEGAVDDPDSLADLLRRFDEDIDGDAEELGWAADEAYDRLTGDELPELGIPEPERPEGPPLDLRDPQALANRVPRVWERFC